MLAKYAPKGLRLIEVDKADLVDLPDIVERIEGRRERFIVFCDDLTFDAGEAGYKALKVALDGSIAGPSDNVLIYATSNRRHLLPEYMSENLETKHVGDEVHPGESVEEKISLSERFGLWISFYPFAQDDYLAAVARLARAVGRRRAGEREGRGGPHARGAAVRAAARLALGTRRVAVREALRRRARATLAKPLRRLASAADGIARVAAAVDAARRRRGAARAASRRQALRGLLGVPRRQARAGRVAASRARPRAREELGPRRCAARRRGSCRSSSTRTRTSSSISSACSAWDGEPVGHDGQAFAWQRPGAFDVAPLLPANTRVLAALALPAIDGHHLRRRAGRGRVPRAGATRARGRTAPASSSARRPGRRARLDAFARRLLPIARAHGATRRGQRHGGRRARGSAADGVHWTAAALIARDGASRTGMLVGASCHTRDELARAACARRRLRDRRAGARRRRRTRTRRRSAGTASRASIEGTRVPVYALGGLARDDLAAALDRGAHGDRDAARRLAALGSRADRAGGSSSSGGSTAGIAVRLARPRAEVDELAALRAERPQRRLGSPLDRRAATRAGAHHLAGRPCDRSPAAVKASEVAERELELDVAGRRRCRGRARDADEADVERVLVGADLGHARRGRARA